MVTAAVGNHGVENSRRMRSVKRALAVAKKTWRRDDVMVAAITAFFRLQIGPNLQSGHILVIVRMLRDSWSRIASEPICRSCKKKVVARGGNTSNLLTFTLRQ